MAIFGRLQGLAGFAAILVLFASLPVAAQASGSATTTLGVSITITSGCTVSTTTAVAFTTQATLTTAATATGALAVTCTNTTPYVVSLDKGGGSGASTTVRKMTGPSSAIINYALYQNSGMTTNFGNTAGTDTVAGTGNGAAQAIPVYGQVPIQTSPAPGSYADVVNVTVSF